MSALRRQQGFSLVEVLVAFLVLMIGILGVGLLEGTAKRGTFDALQRSLATTIADDVIERMRSNVEAVRLGLYNGDLGGGAVAVPAVDCGAAGANCTAAQLADFDRYQVEQRLLGADAQIGGADVGGLTNATTCINHLNGQLTVVVVWQGQVALSDAGDGAASFIADCGLRSDLRRQFVVQSFIDS